MEDIARDRNPNKKQANLTTSKPKGLNIYDEKVKLPQIGGYVPHP